LKSICIPASGEILESECFDDCTSLTKVTFEPNSRLGWIGYWAFSKCLSLKSLV
jgi:hypothetical protein